MSYMRAVDIRGGHGPASALFINPEIIRPEPKAHECLVEVKAFGLNRGDTVQRQGLYPMPPTAPKTLGLEFSGVIISVGTEASKIWAEGTQVFGLVYGGAYAEYVAVDSRLLIEKPESITWEVAGGFCESWFTALQAIYMVGDYDPETTNSILWNAGASTISICGIQLSRILDSSPKVFATTRQDSKADFCIKELGCTDAVNTTSFPSDGWVEKIKDSNDGKGIDLIIDFIGGSSFTSLLNLAALDARIVNLGLLGGAMIEEGKAVNISPFVMKRLRYEGSTLRSRTVEYQAKVCELFKSKVLPAVLDGKLTHFVDKVFPWEEVDKAHEFMEANGAMGKIVCVIN